MRKKSHIKLASFLMTSLNKEELYGHKKSFWIGSILPDCTPSFITTRHTIDETFNILKEEIENLLFDYDYEKGMTRKYCRRLGVVSHYLADYCTYPHNSIFEGNMKEHCVYESDLKRALSEYVKSPFAKKANQQIINLKTAEDICEYIKEKHNEYLKAIKTVQIDCMYIVELCHCVIDAIIRIFELRINTNSLKVVTA